MNEAGNVKSADRVLSIIDDFADKKRPQRASEIAKSLSIPISSCLALLLTMVDRDILDYDASTKTYVPSTRLRRMTDWLDVENGLEHRAIRSARRLHRELGQPVAVCRRAGLYIEWLYTIDVARLIAGERRPVCHSVNGLAVLTQMSEPDVETLVDAHNERFGRQGPVVLNEMLRKVRVLKGRGYVSGSTQLVPGLASICFLMRDAARDEEMLVGVQVNASDLARREPGIVQAARRILPDLVCA